MESRECILYIYWTWIMMHIVTYLILLSLCNNLLHFYALSHFFCFQCSSALGAPRVCRNMHNLNEKCFCVNYFLSSSVRTYHAYGSQNNNALIVGEEMTNERWGWRYRIEWITWNPGVLSAALYNWKMQNVHMNLLVAALLSSWRLHS